MTDDALIEKVARAIVSEAVRNEYIDRTRNEPIPSSVKSVADKTWEDWKGPANE